MKNKNYFKKAALLILVCSTQFITAQIPSYVPTNGLVGYWPFSGNANDASGNGNNGTVNGATLTTDRFGSANSAYSFDGVSNYINIANNILPTTSTSLTVSLWFLTSDNDGHFISDRSGAGNTSKYSISTGGTNLGSGCENGNCSSTCGQYLTTVAPSGTTWNNAVLVKDMALNVCKIYLNGVLAATRNNFCYTNFSSPTAIGRGNSYYTPDGYINGKIDDVGIWNRALTEAEITTMYNGVTYTDTCTGLNGTLLNGLAAYYPFCGNANDQSGNGHNGTVTGATLTADRFGNPNSAYSFNGTSSYIYAGNIASLAGTSSSSTTVSLWVNYNFTSGVNGDFFDLRSTNNSAFQIYTNNVNSSFGVQGNHYNAPISTGFYTPSSNSLTNNQWYHIIYILNNATGHATLYVNGIQVGDTAGTVGLLTNPKLNIGSRFDFYNSRCCYFKGAIDDVCFWNRALTQAEITTMYNGVASYSDTCNAVSGSLTQGLVGYWPFCGNANDDSGKGNNGTVNGATLTTDRFGNANSAYSFNGSTNKIGLPLQQNNITAYTISAWYKTSIGGPILSGRGSANQVGMTLDIKNVGTGGTLQNGKARYIADGSLIELGKITNNTYIDNQWHHIIGVYSGTIGAINGSQFSIYIDNILVAQSLITTGSTTAPINNGTNLLIGAHQIWTPGGYFNGILDDIGIWNRALTTQEITQLYNQNQCFTNTTVTETLVINVGQLSYTNPIAYANNITIYPNPASTQVNIAFNNISNLNGGIIKIINSLGQQVATTPITTSGTNTTMTLNSWGGAGLYFVQIVNPQGQIVDIKKILLQ